MVTKQHKRNIYLAILLLCHLLLVIVANLYEGRHLMINSASLFSSGLTQFDYMNFKELGVFNVIMPIFALAILIYLVVRLIQHFRWKLVPVTLIYLGTFLVNVGAIVRFFFDVPQLDFALKLNNMIISAPTGHGCDGYWVCLVYLLILIVSFSLIAISPKEPQEDIELQISHIFNVKQIGDEKDDINIK